MKKLIVTMALVGALVGCSSARVIESRPVSPKLHELKTVQLLIDVDEPISPNTVRYFRSSLISELCKRDVFVKFVTSKDAGAADLKMSIVLAGLEEVSTLERVIFAGPPAGKAKLMAIVKLTDLKSGEQLGAFRVLGKSSGWGTTLEGIEVTAGGVAEHLAKISVSQP